MNNYYNLFERCLQNEGTTTTYCSKILKNIIPNEKIEFESVTKFSTLSTITEKSLNLINYDLVNIKILSKISSFNNDDARYYLDSILHLLEKSEYLNDYKITFDNKNDSLIAIMHATDEEKKSEIYELFNEFPKSLNSRVLAYLS